MNLATKDSKLCDIIMSEPNIVTVLNRFGIVLGVGDKSIAMVCEEHNIDKEFMLTILNTFINEEYFPETILKSLNVTDIIEYLRKTNESYIRFQIPNIERHFRFLIAQSSNSNNLQLMLKFFEQVKTEMTSRMENDAQVLFPKLIELCKSKPSYPISKKEQEDDGEEPIEEKLSDLLNLFIIHLSGDYDVNLCHAVLLAIFNLEKDFKQNNRIRRRILLPYAKLVNIDSI